MPATRLTTARLDLVPLTAVDADDLFPVLNDAALGRWTGEAPPTDIEALRRRFEAWEVGGSPDGTERWLNWTMRRREDGRAIGHLQSTITAGSAAIAWVVGSAYQRQGLATEAAHVLVAWLREDRGITTIEASIHRGNMASQAVAQRAGLRPTDRLHDGEVVWELSEDPATGPATARP